MSLLPDNPTRFDYLHAIRAVAARGGDKEIFKLADEAMFLEEKPNPDVVSCDAAPAGVDPIKPTKLKLTISPDGYPAVIHPRTGALLHYVLLDTPQAVEVTVDESFKPSTTT